MKDVLVICVIAGVTVGAIACRKVEGMGFRGQVVGRLKKRRVMRCLIEIADDLWRRELGADGRHLVY